MHHTNVILSHYDVRLLFRGESGRLLPLTVNIDECWQEGQTRNYSSPVLVQALGRNRLSL